MTRLIDNFRPFLRLIPDIKEPTHKILFEERIVWTLCVLVLFLICSQVPLYGMMNMGGSDPLYWMRLILASNRGSLTELGITPTVSSSMIIQLLIGTKLLDVNMNITSDRNLVNGVQRLLAIIIALGQALVSVWTGVYGPPGQMGYHIIILLVTQLMVASFITTLLDEIMLKGYGLGSGISLFIATNICEGMVWRCFSPTTLNTGRGVEFEGAVLALFYLLATKSNKLSALKQAFFRKSLPNMSSVCTTGILMLLVVYLQGFRHDVRIRSTVHRGRNISFPIRLFYTSSMPITLFSAVSSNFFFLSQFLYRRWPDSLPVRLMGQWGSPSSYSPRPTGGFSYFLSPPASWSDALSSPLHLIVYISIIVVCCGTLSRVWCESSGNSPRDVIRSLKDRNYIESGPLLARDSRDISRAIFTAATLGGVLIGLLSVFADLFGAIGSGTGILIAVTIIYQYIEMIANARADS